MPAVNKQGLQLLVPPDTKLRARALAVVRTESQAETLRHLINAGLPALEREQNLRLLELRAALIKQGLEYADGVDRMLAEGVTYADLFDGNGVARRSFPKGRKAA